MQKALLQSILDADGARAWAAVEMHWEARAEALRERLTVATGARVRLIVAASLYAAYREGHAAGAQQAAAAERDRWLVAIEATLGTLVGRVVSHLRAEGPGRAV